jgi:hypothetical protein
MSTTKRVFVGIIILVLLTAGILVVESSRRGGSVYRLLKEGTERFSGACIPVYSGKDLVSKFCSDNASRLSKRSFNDKAEKKLQEGWLLRDVVLLSFKKEDMKPGTRVRVSSSNRHKDAVIDWKDVGNEANLVILAPTKNGTLKLAATMPGLDTRDRWVQEVDRIEVIRP